jgi:hypothetical protein
MAAASYVPTKQKLSQVNGVAVINFASDTLKAMLVVAGSGIPSTSKTGVQYVSDVTGSNSEVTGTGYSRQTLTSVTVAFDASATTQVDFSHAAITFAQNAAGFTNARYLALIKDTGSDATSPVFLIFDFNTTLSAQTGDVVFTSPTGGELQWS